MQIRTMTEHDIKQVQQVARLSWNDTYHNILPQDFIDKFVEKAYSYDSLNKRLKETLFLVADNKSVIEGFINIAQREGYSELAAIYLLPSTQRKGLGTMLLHAAFKEVNKGDKVIVYVEKENVKGLSFYKKNGFELVEEFEEELLGEKVQTIKLEIS
jgi:ribosomal protein S18 acetylase RimI-like enzyme